MPATATPVAVGNDSSVSDSLSPHVYKSSACKLYSCSCVVCCHISLPPLSTSASEMNILFHTLCSGVSSAPQNDAVPQVMISDAAPSIISSVIIPKTKDKKSHFHVNCYLRGCHRTVKVAAMVDSGATSLFLDQKYADRHKMWQIPLEHPIILYNIDGSLNKAGSITHKVKLQLWIGPDYEEHEFLLTSLGPENIILGLPWLHSRNPAIDWQAGTM